MIDSNFNDRQSDQHLMIRIQTGERGLFDLLVGRYQRALLRVAESRLGRCDWAEDVVQETFLAAFKSCATFDPTASFRTWLWTILFNQCHRSYRSRVRIAEHDADREYAYPETSAVAFALATSTEPSPPDSLMAKEREAQLEWVLRQLTPVQADALRLRFYGELKFREIADTMQCSLLTAKNRVRCGLLRMSELLEGGPVQQIQGNDELELHHEL